MHFKNGLALLSRTSDRRCWNVVSFHSPHSMTWTWILSFAFPRADEGRWLGFWRRRSALGLQWGVQVARCSLQWHRQSPMWYRDAYYRLRDKQDAALSNDRPLPHALPPLPPSAPVADGGNSLH